LTHKSPFSDSDPSDYIVTVHQSLRGDNIFVKVFRIGEFLLNDRLGPISDGSIGKILIGFRVSVSANTDCPTIRNPKRQASVRVAPPEK
jgi:hypothetical protein